MNEKKIRTEISRNKYHLNKNQQGLFKMPISFKADTDILVDSIYINIPSEGNIIKVYNKGVGKLYISKSLATMSKYYYEIYKRPDSIFIIKRIKEYDRPLTMLDVNLISQNNEFIIYVDNKVHFYVKNDTVIKKNNIKEIEYLLKKILNN